MCEFSIVMPCLNESETLAICILKAKRFFIDNKINYEIIIADNGSTDGSQQIAIDNGARVVNVAEKGYGSALYNGMLEAKGKYILMGDSDNSYDFSNLMPFVTNLREGYELVMGNRFLGGIENGAMPFLHKYLGNPVLSFIGRLFFKTNINDFHCGLRGFTKDAFEKMNLKTKGMEFASEIVVKSALLNLKMKEVPTTLHKDGRNRPPHLNTWRDGWRHLSFLLVYSPKWLFLYPGIVFILLSIFLGSILAFNSIQVLQIRFDLHTLMYNYTMGFIGVQFILFYWFSRVFAITQDLLPESNKNKKVFSFFNLEKGLLIGFFILICGLSLLIFQFSQWQNSDFGNLDLNVSMRIVIPSVFMILLGIQTILSSFFLRILGIKK